MKNIKQIVEEGKISRATVYYRLERIEEIIGKQEKVYEKGKTNDDRILADEVSRMIVNYVGKRTGPKPKLKNSSLTGLSEKDIDEVLK